MNQGAVPWWAVGGMVTWVVLGVAGTLLLFLSRDASLKRRLFRPYVFLVGVLFLVFLLGSWIPSLAYLIIVPAVALIIGLNIYLTQFCDTCGRTIVSNNMFSRASFCPKCGARMSR